MDEEDSQLVAETAEQRHERRIAAVEQRDEIRTAAQEIIISSTIIYSLSQVLRPRIFQLFTGITSLFTGV